MTEWDNIIKKAQKPFEKKEPPSDEEIKKRLIHNQIALDQKIKQLEKKLEAERRMKQMQSVVIPQYQQALPQLPQMPLPIPRRTNQPVQQRAGPSGFTKTAGMFATGRGIRKSWRGVR